MTLCSTSLQVLVPKGEMLLLGDTIIIPWNWKLILPLSHFELLMPLGQQGKKSFTGLTGVIDPDYQREIEELPGTQWLRLSVFTAGPHVRSLVREPGCCKLHGADKNSNNNNKTNQKKQRETGLLLHNTDSLGYKRSHKVSLSITMPVIKVSGKL